MITKERIDLANMALSNAFARFAKSGCNMDNYPEFDKAWQKVFADLKNDV